MIGKLMDSIEGLVSSIEDELRVIADVSDNDEILDRVEKVSIAVSDIRDICQDDWESTDESFNRDDWDQFIETIPDPAQMSAGEMESLLETIRTWRRENGYPVPYSCY